MGAICMLAQNSRRRCCCSSVSRGLRIWGRGRREGISRWWILESWFPPLAAAERRLVCHARARPPPCALHQSTQMVGPIAVRRGSDHGSHPRFAILGQTLCCSRGGLRPALASSARAHQAPKHKRGAHRGRGPCGNGGEVAQVATGTSHLVKPAGRDLAIPSRDFTAYDPMIAYQWRRAEGEKTFRTRVISRFLSSSLQKNFVPFLDNSPSRGSLFFRADCGKNQNQKKRGN